MIVGGYVLLDCPSLLGDTVGNVSKEIEICTEAGFPPRGSDALPDTGGLPVLSVLGALLLVAGALGFLGFRRWYVP